MFPMDGVMWKSAKMMLVLLFTVTDGADTDAEVIAVADADVTLCRLYKTKMMTEGMYSNFRNYAPPLDEKGGIITEKVVPVFSESFFGACFGMVM